MDRTPRKDFTPEEFKALYSRVPRSTVEVLVRTPKGLILLKRAIPPRLGEWHIPGGTIFMGEPVEDALHRVAWEELGVRVRIEKLLGYIEYPGMHRDGYFGWPIGLAFEVTITEGTPSDGEQGEVGYFTSVPENIVPDQAEWLRRHYFTDDKN